MTMIDFQSHFLFPVQSVARCGPLPPTAATWVLPTGDGAELHGVHFPPEPQRESGPRVLVLGFGGNAWNGQDVASYLHEVFPGIDVVAFHYRGYAPSTGSPSARALMDDAPRIYDFATDRLKPDLVVATGFSIGSGIACTLAGSRPLDGAILVTPFDSLKAVAQDAFPWFPIGPFFAHEIDSVAAIRGTTLAVALVAAERDEIISARRTDALRREIPNLVFDRTIAGAGHNDLYARSSFQLAMDEALDAILAA